MWCLGEVNYCERRSWWNSRILFLTAKIIHPSLLNQGIKDLCWWFPYPFKSRQSTFQPLCNIAPFHTILQQTEDALLEALRFIFSCSYVVGNASSPALDFPGVRAHQAVISTNIMSTDLQKATNTCDSSVNGDINGHSYNNVNHTYACSVPTSLNFS